MNTMIYVRKQNMNTMIYVDINFRNYCSM